MVMYQIHKEFSMHLLCILEANTEIAVVRNQLAEFSAAALLS